MEKIYISTNMRKGAWELWYSNEVIATFTRAYEAEACVERLEMLGEERMQEIIKELRSDKNE